MNIIKSLVIEKRKARQERLRERRRQRKQFLNTSDEEIFDDQHDALGDYYSENLTSGQRSVDE